MHELRFRVADRLLRLAARYAAAVSYPLDDWSERARLEYVGAFQDAGMSLEQIARRSAKSRRTIATLSSARKAMQTTPPHLSVARLEEGVSIITLRSEIVRALSRVPNATVADLVRILDLKRAYIVPALGVLIDDDVVRKVGKGYVVGPQEVRFDTDEAESRIAFLDKFLHAVERIVRTRFVRTKDDEAAFARVFVWSQDLRFRATATDELLKFVHELTNREDARVQANLGQDASTAAPMQELTMCLGVVATSEKS